MLMIFVISSFWLLWAKLLCTFLWKFLRDVNTFLLGIYLGKQCILRLPSSFQSDRTILYSQQECISSAWWGVLTCLPTGGFVHLLKILVFQKLYNDIALWFQFVLSWWLKVLNTFQVVTGPFYILFYVVPAQVAICVFKFSYFLFIVDSQEFLIYYGCQPFVRHIYCANLLLACGLYFHPPTGAF